MKREGEADLRLVPPALAAWGTAAWALGVPLGVALAVAVGCGVVAGVLLVGRRSGWSGVTGAGVLLCAGAAAVVGGVHGDDVRRGPVPELAAEFAEVRAEVRITSDARRTRPRVTGDRMARDAVVVDAEVVRVVGPGGREVVTRAPVLVVVSGEGGAGWLGLLPSTRVRVAGQLVPPMAGGDEVAAVLRVRGEGGPAVVGGKGAGGPAVVGVRGEAGPEVVAGKGAGGPEVVGEASWVQRVAGRLRAGLREATEGLPGDARALLPGLVVGDTSQISAELDEAFKETDLAHTLAVSGSNLTIILVLLLGPPGVAQHVERRGLAPRLGVSLRGTALLGGGLTLAFVMVCRPDPSVLRAAACGAVVLVALATGRRRTMLPALATAVLVLMLYDPWLARSYGFLLSVLATGALLTVAPRWSAALRRRGVPARLAEGVAAAGAAQALCAPVVAVLSARVSLVAVPCNLLVEFAVAPATVLGFAALAVAPVAMPVAKVLAWCASWPAGWIADVARTGAALPGAGVDWPGGWGGAVALGAVTFVAVLLGRRVVGRPLWCGVLGVLLVLVVLRPVPLTRVVTGWPPPGWRLAVCDVGQGDAAVLAAGEGAGVVVDAGPDPRAVDRCLRKLGITRVPLVVLTHFHADHVAGLAGVLRGRAVGAVQVTGFEEPVDQVEFVRRTAREAGVPVVRAAAGERRRVGELEWEVLWPPAEGAPVEGANDASVAMFVRVGGLRVLMLGDLEPVGQRAMAEAGAVAEVLRGGVDVVKVAHHGSAHQDAGLMRAVGARVALISCGADNSYGHPAPSTVAGLREAGAVVLRTDRDGGLAVSGAGEGVRVTGGG